MAASAPSRLPIGLLDEADEAEEVLFLTYTANLEFFERLVLQRTRGLQARATVIADSAMVSSDPVSVRHAGVQYLDARAVSPRGAFHPKLIVVGGADAATLAVGSGNLTLAGWHGNSELWTVLRGDAGSVPDTFAQAAALLRGLAASPIILSPGAGEALGRAAAWLDRGIPSFPGPRLVSSLEEPIIEQLPRGPVDELVVYAPFHDARLEALEALVERFGPSELTVFVGPDTTVDGPRLATFLAGIGGRLAWAPERPHHHGKLVSWRIGQQWWALTGSPNLSAPALLGTAEDGNCEVGLLSEIEGPLSPEETEPPTRGLASLNGPEPSVEPLARSLLLAAVVESTGTVIHLAGGLDEPAAVEVFDRETGSFAALEGGEVPPGRQTHTIAVRLAAGTALQLVLRDSQTRSNRVYVTDMAAVQRRPLQPVGKALTSVSDLVLGDAFEQLLEDIDALRPHLAQMRIIEPVGGSTPTDEDAGATAGELPLMRPARGRSLEEYLDGIRTVLGDPLTSWALSLPAIPGTEGEQVLGATGLVADTDGEAEDDEEDVLVVEPPLIEILDTLTDYQRGRLRRFTARLLGRAVSAPPIVRILAGRLVLHGIAAQLWPDPLERGEIILSAAETLSAPGDEPTGSEQVAAASIGAVLLALLRAQVERRSVRDEAELRFERAERLLAPLLEHCSTRDLTRLAGELEPRLGAQVGAEVVLQTALEAIEQERGYARAIALLQDDHGIAAEERDGGLALYAQLPAQPEYFLILAVSLAEGDVSPVIVRGRTAKGPVVAVWRAPWLVISHDRPAGQRGELYHLSAGADPRSLVAVAAGGDLREALPRRAADWMPGRPPEGVAADLLALAAQAAGGDAAKS